MTGSPPSDATSLLVPVDLAAWVFNETNQENLAWYEPNYDQLRHFASVIPQAFQVKGYGKPQFGVHLHWALPDGLTHGRRRDDGSATFPPAPNRWLVARFYTPHGGTRQATLWVIESDRIVVPDQANGTGSPFLDPSNPTYMTVDAAESTTFVINEVQIGGSHTIDQWEANPASGPATPLLTAVGPANVSFGAYAPFGQEVFAFVDELSGLPTDVGPGLTYMVVGWHSDPGTGDPLRGVGTFVPESVWKTEADWASQTPAERFAALLADLGWSVDQQRVSAPPATTLYHGTVVGVDATCTTLGNAGVDPDKVRVAVGNTAGDALSAMVHSYAEQQAVTNAGDAEAWRAAGALLADLIPAAMYDMLDIYGTPGGSVELRQRRQESWFGATPGGTVWEVVSALPPAVGVPAQSAELTPDQAIALANQLAALNGAQRALDTQQRELVSMQQVLYEMWIRVGRANWFPWGSTPVTTPAWGELKAFLTGTIYPDVIDEVWDGVCAVQAAAAELPDPIDPAAASKWADRTWSFPAPGGPTTLSELGLTLKAVPDHQFSHPVDPVVLVAGLGRAQRHGEDGRFSDDGTMRCRLPGETVTGVTISGQPEITAAQLSGSGAVVDPASGYAQIPSMPGFATEVFLADPANATTLASVSGGSAGAIESGLASLLNGDSTAGSLGERRRCRSR